MEAKELWQKACKQTLEDISKAFTDEENLSKFSEGMDRVKFRALGKKIQEFPIPECPFQESTSFGADLVIVTGKGTTSATTNKILVRNSVHTILAEISINDDGSGYSYDKKPEPPYEYEYEMFFKSELDDFCKIDGWYPIAIDRIKNPEKIDEYIEKGLLRKIIK